jgi:hypothetical protein
MHKWKKDAEKNTLLNSKHIEYTYNNNSITRMNIYNHTNIQLSKCWKKNEFVFKNTSDDTYIYISINKTKEKLK